MVVRCGAVPLLVQLLYSKDVHVCEQALWALANISGDGPECRDFVVSSGIIDPLLSFVNPGTPVGLPPLSSLPLCSSLPPYPSLFLSSLSLLSFSFTYISPFSFFSLLFVSCFSSLLLLCPFFNPLIPLPSLSLTHTHTHTAACGNADKSRPSSR